MPVKVSEARSIVAIISGKLKVRIEEGHDWSYNFDRGTINYRIADLKTATRVEVIGNLLHESGHAKYSTNPRNLIYDNLEKQDHRDKMHFLINAIEDFRIEDLVRAFYPYAVDYLPEYSFKTLFILKAWEENFTDQGEDVPKFIQYCFAIYSYLAHSKYEFLDPEVLEVVEKTKDYALNARYFANTQEICSEMMAKVYPLVKEWLDEYDNREVDVTPFEIKGMDDGRWYPTYDELFAEVKPLIKPTGEKFRRVLSDNLFDKYNGKYRTGGRIIQNKLYRHEVGDYRLFQRRIDAKSKDYIFALLVDESGSMEGDKTINAVKAAILFSQVLVNLNIPFGLYGFNSRFKKYKSPFEQLSAKHFPKYEEMMYNTSVWKSNNESGYNNDPEAIFLVTEDMRKLSDKKRVIIVLSDGEPAPTEESKGKGFKSLKNQVALAEKKGFDLIGIGIQTPAVENYYTHSLIVKDLSELPATIITTLKNKLKH